MDAVILCGGQGMRLRHLLPDGTPKCMADINGTPFIEILIQHLASSGYRRFILAAGYGQNVLYCHLFSRTIRRGIEMEFYREDTPLGTAGAILAAQRYVKSEPFLILNGDTYCDVDYGAMEGYHLNTNSTITVACDGDFRYVGAFMASERFGGFIPPDCKVDMAEMFTLIGQRHEPVGWFYTDAPFYDIGTPEGLETFRAYWTKNGTKT